MDGALSYPIRSFSKSKDKYSFELIDSYMVEKSQEGNYSLTIHVVDEDNLIAIWEHTMNDRTYYDLMVPEFQKSKFPIIWMST